MGFEENTSSLVVLFFNELEKHYTDKHIIVVFDNAGSHQPKIVRERARMTFVFLPPYSPELNPTERFFEEIRKATANQIFETLDTQEAVIEKTVKLLSGDEEKMKRLVGYEWIIKQIGMG